MTFSVTIYRRGSQWPRCLRSVAAWLLGSRVRIPLGVWMFVVLSCVGRGLCDRLITRPEESYRVSVCVRSRNPKKGGQRSVLDYKRLWMNDWMNAASRSGVICRVMNTVIIEYYVEHCLLSEVCLIYTMRVLALLSSLGGWLPLCRHVSLLSRRVSHEVENLSPLASLCPHVTRTWEPVNWWKKWNLIFGNCTKMCLHIRILVKMGQ
jgi:hypothetical protein